MKDKDPFATTALTSMPADDAAQPARRTSAPMTHEDAGKFLILVVDDAADNVAVISLALQHEGYRVVTASNGEEAISVAKATLPNLILMDISMPTMDGLAATRRLRQTGPLAQVPVVAITAFGTEGFQRAAYDAGVAGYLTKPIDFARMNQLVAGLLSPDASGNLNRAAD